MHYKIRVRGQLSGAMLGAFPELRAQVQGAETLLAGQLPDQAALFGVLAWIEALGLELLEVLRTEDNPDALPPHRRGTNPMARHRRRSG